MEYMRWAFRYNNSSSNLDLLESRIAISSLNLLPLPFAINSSQWHHQTVGLELLHITSVQALKEPADSVPVLGPNGSESAVCAWLQSPEYLRSAHLPLVRDLSGTPLVCEVWEPGCSHGVVVVSGHVRVGAVLRTIKTYKNATTQYKTPTSVWIRNRSTINVEVYA